MYWYIHFTQNELCVKVGDDPNYDSGKSFLLTVEHRMKPGDKKEKKKMKDRRKTGKRNEDRNKKYCFLPACQHLVLCPIQQFTVPYMPGDPFSSNNDLDQSENLPV